MTFSQLHYGVEVPEYGAHVPWLIAPADLPKYVPEGGLVGSAAGWAQLRFTLLGVTATYAFNFVSHPEHKLLEVRFTEPAGEGIVGEFRANAAVLRARLGTANAVNQANHFHLMWRDDRVWVDYSAGMPENPAAERRHSLSVYFHAGMPRAWVAGHERTLTQVKRLLNLTPGVEVDAIWVAPNRTCLSLAIRSPQSLARLTHAARGANVALRVEVNAYREANGPVPEDDPNGILYRVEVDGPREPGPGGDSTPLQTLGMYLMDGLREQGLLGEGETEGLLAAFNHQRE